MEEKNNQPTKIIGIIIRGLIVLGSFLMIYWYIDSRFIAFENIVGIMFFIILAGCALCFEPLKRVISKVRKKKGGRITVNVVYVLLGLFLIYVAAALSLMFYGANKAPEKNATVIVLGCQVKGTQPSLTLKNRLDTAYEYLTNHPDAKAVLSGGKGDDEDISEAECMYNYLTEKGISADRLYVEAKSTTTSENIRFSKEIIETNGLNTDIAIVTDWYHEYRASVIAKRQGIDNAGAVGAPTPRYLTANLVTREIFALANEIIFK